MSERKALKLEKGMEETRDLLNSLMSISNDGTQSYESLEINHKLETCLKNLKDKNIRPYAVLAISRILQLTASSQETLLAEEEICFFFESALNCIVESKENISQFISNATFCHLKNTELILKFFDAYPRVTFNRETLNETLAMFIDVNPQDREMLVSRVLKKYNAYRDLIPRIIKYIDIEKLEEDLYIGLFCDFQFFRENTELRLVKGRRRVEFIEKAVELHKDVVFNNYIRDRDKRVRILLAGKVSFSYEPFFSILLNDSDEDVRHTLLKRMNWHNAPFSVSDRALDKSSKVRTEIFRMYRELLYHMQVSGDFENCGIFIKKGDNSVLESGKLPFSKEESFPKEKIHDRFINFFSKLCEGCLTGIPQEYIAELENSHFSYSFLYENRFRTGLHIYLNTIQISDLSAIPMHLRDFCLEYMACSATLDASQIRKCIEHEVFGVLKLMSDPYLYFDSLLNKALTIDNLRAVETISEFIKPILNMKSRIFQKPPTLMDSNGENESGQFKYETGTSNSFEFLALNEVFVNAHTKLTELFMEQQLAKLQEGLSYPYLYFLAYKYPDNPDLIRCITNGNVTVPEKIRLLLYLNKPAIVGKFADQLLGHKLNYESQQFLFAKKTTVSALIYFLCTGLVTISNPSFFVMAIKSCLESTNTEKIGHIFEKYVKSVDQPAFNIFYSICWSLKGCSVTNIGDQEQNMKKITAGSDDSLLLNSIIGDTSKASTHLDVFELEDTKITIGMPTEINITGVNRENIENSSANKNQFKLKLSKKDKMLSFICDLVIGSREGQLLEISFNPVKYGFFKLDECHIEMIGHNQVIYE